MNWSRFDHNLYFKNVSISQELKIHQNANHENAISSKLTAF